MCLNRVGQVGGNTAIFFFYTYGLSVGIIFFSTQVYLPLPSGYCPSTLSNIIFSETTELIKVKFHVEYLRLTGNKSYTIGPGHRTKMAKPVFISSLHAF